MAALDVLLAMLKAPETVEAYFAEVGSTAGADKRLDSAVARVKDSLTDTATIELRARRVVEQLALVLQGSLLIRHGRIRGLPHRQTVHASDYRNRTSTRPRFSGSGSTLLYSFLRWGCRNRASTRLFSFCDPLPGMMTTSSTSVFAALNIVERTA
jgi:hypothetical protein